MSGKSKKGAAKAVPRAYGRLTRHERDTVQRMLERRASCREIASELGRSPSTVSAEVSSHRFVAAPKPRRGERVDAGTDLSAACLPAPGGVAALPRRLRPLPRGGLHALPARLLRGPRRAAVRGLGARLVQARDRRRRARRDGEA